MEANDEIFNPHSLNLDPIKQNGILLISRFPLLWQQHDSAIQANPLLPLGKTSSRIRHLTGDIGSVCG